MVRKKKRLMYEMFCEVCKEPATKDDKKSSENWDVISMTCFKCGGKIKIDFNKPYYEEI